MSGFEWATLIVSIGTSVVAGVLAWRANGIASRSRQDAEEANGKADDANTIAREANAIARESNRIADQATTRIESLEREKLEHERAAIVTITPDEVALATRGIVDGYFPFRITNIGMSRANGVRVRWWMKLASPPEYLLERLLSTSFSLGDIRPDESAAATLLIYLPPTDATIDVRFQLSWDDSSGERYHHSEFVYYFSRDDASMPEKLEHIFVGAYLDTEIHPTYRGRIERQKTLRNLETLTTWLGSPTSPNAPDEWTRLKSASPSTHYPRSKT